MLMIFLPLVVSFTLSTRLPSDPTRAARSPAPAARLSEEPGGCNGPRILRVDEGRDEATASASASLAVSTAPPLGAALRADFPLLHQEVWEAKPLVYLDSAATSQKPTCVLEAMQHHQQKDNANVHRGAHLLSVRSTDSYESARDKVAGFINAASRSEVIFTRGATEAINLVAQTWGRANLGEGDEIILTVMEHHSNLVPWQMLAEVTLTRTRTRTRTRT